ncbi:MAG: hypothetical protein K2F63_03995, partial [Muribaculaceae bacterium]|nr:hypothetical protein [Muribaculaceae bacterium]
MKKYICLFFVLVTASSVLCGKAYGRVFSPATAYFKVMDSSAGLPDNSVNDIEEDEFGFIWVATWNGLARFDGTSFELFRYSDTEQSLSNNMVRCLHNVEGGLWVGTDSGLDFFCYRDLSFTPACFRSESGAPVRFTQRISRIISNRGTIIILTNEGAMYRLDKDSDTSDKDHPYVFTRIVKPQTRRYGDVTVFADGKLMALSNEGVTVLSPNGENELVHNRFPMLFDPNMNIYCDKVRGRVIVGCGVASPARIYNIVSERGVLEPAPDTRDYGGLMSVAADGRNIYLATDGEGLYVQGDPGETAHYLPSNSSIPSDAIYTVFVDSHDNVWCGTYRHGLCLLSPELNSYTLDNVKSGAISYDIVSAILPVGNKFYLGLDGGGLDIYDPATNTSRNFNTSNSDMPGNNVTSLVDDGQHVWMSVYGCGLVSYDKRTGRFRSYRDTAGGNSANKLWVIADGGDGTLWVAGSTLSVFDKATGTFSDIEGCENVSVM